MNKIILLLAIMLSLCSTKLLAQNGGRMQEAWESYLKDSVHFSQPVVDSVMAIRTQYRPQMREIYMDQSSSPEDKKAKMQSLRSEMDVRYKAAGLTNNQVQAIHKHEDWMREQMMNRRNGGGGQ